MDTPSSVTYSSVLSVYSVRIILTIVALNRLEVLGSDIRKIPNHPSQRKGMDQGRSQIQDISGEINNFC